MIVTLLIVALSFLWLLRETDYLRVRLPTGAKPKYATYKAYGILKTRKPNHTDTVTHTGGNLPEDCTDKAPCYNVVLSPGIDNVLCGWEWLDKHCASMVGYKQTFDLNMGTLSYRMVIKDPSVIKDVMKVNKLTKAQKLALAEPEPEAKPVRSRKPIVVRELAEVS